MGWVSDKIAEARAAEKHLAESLKGDNDRERDKRTRANEAWPVLCDALSVAATEYNANTNTRRLEIRTVDGRFEIHWSGEQSALLQLVRDAGQQPLITLFVSADERHQGRVFLHGKDKFTLVDKRGKTDLLSLDAVCQKLLEPVLFP